MRATVPDQRHSEKSLEQRLTFEEIHPESRSDFLGSGWFQVGNEGRDMQRH